MDLLGQQVNDLVLSLIFLTLYIFWLKEYYQLQDDPFFIGMAFANGGDRKEGGVPEDLLEKELGIKMVYNVGGGKTQSSSQLLY